MMDFDADFPLGWQQKTWIFAVEHVVRTLLNSCKAKLQVSLKLWHLGMYSESFRSVPATGQANWFAVPFMISLLQGKWTKGLCYSFPIASD